MTDALRTHAAAVAARSHAPYSHAPDGVALRLTDGRWVAAPRLENASFPLTIPALQGAWALAELAGGTLAAAACSRPFTPGERAFLAEVVGGEATPDGDRTLVWTDAPPGDRVPFAVPDGTDAFEAVHAAAARAVVPASGFRVGAVVADAAGPRVWGANVEHPADWTRGLCAERVALVAAYAEGLGPPARLWLACVSAPGGCSPCGGCRQVLVELAPGAELQIGRGGSAPLATTAEALLPGAFGGADLGRSGKDARGA